MREGLCQCCSLSREDRPLLTHSAGTERAWDERWDVAAPGIPPCGKLVPPQVDRK